MAINFDKYKRYDTTTGFGSAKEWQKGFRAKMSKEEAETIVSKQKETPYTILGVTPSATQDQIKKAFRTMITEWHPDRNPDRIELAEEMSKKIIAAYTILKH